VLRQGLQGVFDAADAGEHLSLLSDECRDQVLQRRPVPFALPGEHERHEAPQQFQTLVRLVSDDGQIVTPPALLFPTPWPVRLCR
jgi:hypothetical protein